MFAGPSEVVIIADTNNEPKIIAADLIAQSEHDPSAQSILICNDENLANNVIKECNEECTTECSRETVTFKNVLKSPAGSGQEHSESNTDLMSQKSANQNE